MNKRMRNTLKRKMFYSHSKIIKMVMIIINIRTVKWYNFNIIILIVKSYIILRLPIVENRGNC